MSGARLQIPIEPGWTPTVVAFVECGGGHYGLESEVARSFAQACASVVEVLLHQEFHHNTSPMELCLEAIPGGLQLTVRDQGLPFDPQMWTRPEVAAKLQDARPVFDKLEFANRGLEGKVTTMVKYAFLNSAPETQNVTVEEAVSGSPVREIRLFQPEDAQAVARCIWRTYGYSYSVLDAVYHPERLATLNEQKLMRSLVAVNQEGEVVGHLAYERSRLDSIVAVGGVASVEPAYRKGGLAKQMAAQLLDLAREDGVRRMQTYAVTTHPYSQRLVHSFGFKACSIVLGASLFCFQGIDQPVQQRESLVGYQLALDPTILDETELLYVPNRHRAMVESMCAHLGVSMEFAQAPPLQLHPGESIISVQESPKRKTAKIHIDRFGSNIVERIRTTARYLRMQDYRCFQLTMHLGDPCTFHMNRHLEKFGFFFSGLQFRTTGTCLLLQDLFGVAIDYDAIQVEDEMAREILSYIRYHEPQSV